MGHTSSTPRDYTRENFLTEIDKVLCLLRHVLNILSFVFQELGFCSNNSNLSEPSLKIFSRVQRYKLTRENSSANFETRCIFELKCQGHNNSNEVNF